MLKKEIFKSFAFIFFTLYTLLCRKVGPLVDNFFQMWAFFLYLTVPARPFAIGARVYGLVQSLISEDFLNIKKMHPLQIFRAYLIIYLNRER